MPSSSPAIAWSDASRVSTASKRRLLVFLQIPVVREREPLERGQQPGQVADHPPGFAPHQLGDVGVLLLGHHRGTGRERVGQPHESELGTRPQHDLLADTREMHLGECGREYGFGHEVSIRDRVERVLESGREPEQGGGAVRIERQARSGQRAGTER